jgi:hypothetical protein
VLDIQARTKSHDPPPFTYSLLVIPTIIIIENNLFVNREKELDKFNNIDPDLRPILFSGIIPSISRPTTLYTTLIPGIPIESDITENKSQAKKHRQESVIAQTTNKDIYKDTGKKGKITKVNAINRIIKGLGILAETIGKNISEISKNIIDFTIEGQV